MRVHSPAITRLPPKTSAAGVYRAALLCALAVTASPGVRAAPQFGPASGEITGGGNFAMSPHYAAYACVGFGGANGTSASNSMQTGCGAMFMSLPADDDDGDGVSNAAEDAAPNGGDANGDGIADSLQSNVASLPGSGGYVTAIVPAGPCASLVSVSPAAAPPANADSGFRYPFGRVALTLPCTTAGASVSVDLLYFGAAPWPPAGLRGFGPTPPQFGASTYHPLSATFGTQAVPGLGNVPVVHLTLTDGQLGDDTAADGTISALFGPVELSATEASATDVPALTNAALMLLALLLAGMALLGLRKRDA